MVLSRVFVNVQAQNNIKESIIFKKKDTSLREIL